MLNDTIAGYDCLPMRPWSEPQLGIIVLWGPEAKTHYSIQQGGKWEIYLTRPEAIKWGADAWRMRPDPVNIKLKYPGRWC